MRKLLNLFLSLIIPFSSATAQANMPDVVEMDNQELSDILATPHLSFYVIA